MRERIKITVLGGSGVYTPGLVFSLADHANELPEIDLVLCGRSKEKLQTVHNVASSIVKPLSGKISITQTTQVEKAIEGSNAVINQIRVGGFAARARDEEFANELEVVEEETMGIVGCANALRTIPVVLRYAAMVEKYAPKAWFLNFTNPASMVIRALLKKTKCRVFGVCDLPELVTHRIASMLDVQRELLYFKYSGLNHLGWIIDVVYRGKSRMGEVLKKPGEFAILGIEPEIVNFTQAVPVPFLKFYYNTDEQIEKAKKKGITRGRELQQLESELLHAYMDTTKRDAPEKLRKLLFQKRNPVWYEYGLVPIIRSLFGRKHGIHILMHRNNGSIDFLNEDDVVETNVFIDENGLKPIVDCRVPEVGRGLVQSVALYERFCVEAAFEPSDEKLLKALMAHPLVPSFRVAKKALPYLKKQFDA